jgi:hypothetical protein
LVAGAYQIEHDKGYVPKNSHWIIAGKDLAPTQDRTAEEQVDDKDLPSVILTSDGSVVTTSWPDATYLCENSIRVVQLFRKEVIQMQRNSSANDVHSGHGGSSNANAAGADAENSNVKVQLWVPDVLRTPIDVTLVGVLNGTDPSYPRTVLARALPLTLSLDPFYHQALLFFSLALSLPSYSSFLAPPPLSPSNQFVVDACKCAFALTIC